jgi:RNA polymerase sigma factor (sigma-70 family)
MIAEATYHPLQDSNDLADLILVSDVRKDPEHFSKLFNKYYSEMRHYILYQIFDFNRGGNERRKAFVDDSVMIIFERLYDRIMTGEKEVRSVKGLLFYYAKLSYMTFVRDYKKDIAHTSMVEEIDWSTIDPETTLINKEFTDKFSVLITWLPEIYREAAKMYFLDNYLQKEISEKLGVTIPAVEHRIAYAREFIAARIVKDKKIERRKKAEFSKQEIDYIESNFYTMNLKEIADELNKSRELKVSKDTVRNYCERYLNLVHGRTGAPVKHQLTDMEEALIKANPKMPHTQMADLLNNNRAKPISITTLRRLRKQII